MLWGFYTRCRLNTINLISNITRLLIREFLLEFDQITVPKRVLVMCTFDVNNNRACSFTIFRFYQRLSYSSVIGYIRSYSTSASFLVTDVTHGPAGRHGTITERVDSFYNFVLINIQNDNHFKDGFFSMSIRMKGHCQVRIYSRLVDEITSDIAYSSG